MDVWTCNFPGYILEINAELVMSHNLCVPLKKKEKFILILWCYVITRFDQKLLNAGIKSN